MELTGLQNPMVKAAAELKQKKYRQQLGGRPAYCGRGSALRRRAEHFLYCD